MFGNCNDCTCAEYKKAVNTADCECGHDVARHNVVEDKAAEPEGGENQ